MMTHGTLGGLDQSIELAAFQDVHRKCVHLSAKTEKAPNISNRSDKSSIIKTSWGQLEMVIVNLEIVLKWFWISEMKLF